MPSVLDVGKVVPKTFSINGANLIPQLRSAVIRESVCNYHISGQFMIFDNDNVIQKYEIKSGDRVSFAFTTDVPQDRTRRSPFMYILNDLIILNVQSPTVSKNLKTRIYNIDVMTSEFLIDKGSTVQEVVRNETAGDAFKRIHDTFYSTVPVEVRSATSLLSAAGDGINGLNLSGKWAEVLKSIAQNAKFITAPSEALFFRTGNSFVFTSLYDMLSNRNSTRTLKQRATWGTSIHDMFTWSADAIEDAMIIPRGAGSGGYTGMTELLQNYPSSMVNVNLGSGTIDVNKVLLELVSDVKVPGVRIDLLEKLTSIGEFIKSNIGAQAWPFNMAINSNQLGTSQTGIDTFDRERLLSILVKEGPQCNMRVPVPGAIDINCGQSVKVELVNPIGDRDNKERSIIRGDYIVSDKETVLRFDNAEKMGYIVLQGILGGFQE